MMEMTVYPYGLCAAAAALILMLGMKASRKLPGGSVSLFGVLGVVLGVAGARLLYCLCNLSTFTETFENPWLMLCFFDGGLSMPGAIGGLLAAAAITARIKNVSFAKVMDALCLPLGLSTAILRFGEQFTDLGVGKAVTEGFATANLPWLFLQSRMGKAVEYRLNVWMYEAVIGILICLVTVLLYRTLRRRDGDTALFFFALCGASQILLESMRDDGHMLLIFLRIGQLGAAAMVIGSTAILLRRSNRKCLHWLVVLLCVAAVVVLEFSLDGRLTFGRQTLVRDYSLMTAACAALLANALTVLFPKRA